MRTPPVQREPVIARVGRLTQRAMRLGRPDIGRNVGRDADREIPFGDRLVPARRRSLCAASASAVRAPAPPSMMRGRSILPLKWWTARRPARSAAIAAAPVPASAVRWRARAFVARSSRSSLRLARRLRDRQRPGRRVEQAGDVVPGALGERDAGLDLDDALAVSQAGRRRPAAPMPSVERAAAARPAQHRLLARGEQASARSSRQRRSAVGSAEIERARRPRSPWRWSALPVVLALQRPGDRNLAIARALRVRIAADHAGDARADSGRRPCTPIMKLDRPRRGARSSGRHSR